MSVTRLLVLGAVRILQPAHGYLVRRELASWQVDEWANLNPGSVYNALRTLTRDGMLVEGESVHSALGPPARTAYRLTPDGDTEFLRLVREALWQLHPHDPSWLSAGISFWWALSRGEVLDALTARTAQITAKLVEAGYTVGDVERSAGMPAHVVEHFHLQEERLRGELVWVAAAMERIRAGAYGFDGEDPARMAPPAAAGLGPASITD